jgi:hypothetical protein
MQKITITAALVILTLSGCVSTGSGDKNPLMTNLNQGNIDAAIKYAEDEAEIDPETGAVDDQLSAMQAGALHRMKGNFEKSNKLFDSIEDVMYAEDDEGILESGAESAGSLLTNDTFLDYEQTLYDAVMVNTYKALNFEALDDSGNARVEWNRVADRQRRAAEFYASQIADKKEEAEAAQDGEDGDAVSDEQVEKSVSQSQSILAEKGIDMSGWKSYEGYVNPFSTFMHGLYFLRHAQDGADVEKAIDSFERVYGLTESEVAKETLDYAMSLRDKGNRHSQEDKVWVIVEAGESAYKEEFEVDLPLFLVTENVAYTGIALPRIETKPDVFGAFAINSVEADVVSDMDRIIQADFKDKFPAILTREITRATLKTVMQKQIMDQNVWAGMAAGIVQAVTTDADTRSWTLLPKNYQAVMLERPDDGIITIDNGRFLAPLTIDLNATPGDVVHVRAIAPSIAPSYTVL